MLVNRPPSIFLNYFRRTSVLVDLTDRIASLSIYAIHAITTDDAGSGATIAVVRQRRRGVHVKTTHGIPDYYNTNLPVRRPEIVAARDFRLGKTKKIYRVPSPTHWRTSDMDHGGDDDRTPGRPNSR